jgi:hypothetical protein
MGWEVEETQHEITRMSWQMFRQLKQLGGGGKFYLAEHSIYVLQVELEFANSKILTEICRFSIHRLAFGDHASGCHSAPGFALLA